MSRGNMARSLLIFCAIWVFLSLAGRSKLLRDPGTFWHVMVGRQILATGSLPETDSFSFTFQGQPWIAQQWLGEAGMALLDGVGGLDALALTTTLYLAVIFSWLALRLIHAGVPWLLVFLLIALAGAASSYHFHARPFIVHFAFLGWTFALLCDWEAGRTSLAKLFWLPLLYVVWTNIHGGVLGGIATLGVAGIGWTLFHWLGLPSPIRNLRSAAAYALLCALCTASIFVSPYGLEMPRAWLALLGSSQLSELIIEHLPLLRFGPQGYGILVLGAVYLLFLLGVPLKSMRVTWLIPLLWLALAFTKVRHGPLFTLTAVIALADMFPHVRWVPWLSQRGWALFRAAPDRRTEFIPFRWAPGVAACSLLGAGLVLQQLQWPVPLLGKGWARLDPSHWPVALLPELKKLEAESARGRPIVNDMLFGGFLIYHAPRFQVFIDDRCELYGPGFLRDYAVGVRENPAQVDGWLKEYSPELALTRAGSPLDRQLRQRKDWRIIRESAAGTLYCSKPESGF